MLRTIAWTGIIGLAALLNAPSIHAAAEVEPVIGVAGQVSVVGDPTADTAEKAEYGGFDPAVALNPREARNLVDSSSGTPLVESPIMLVTWWGDDNTELTDPDALPADQQFLANDEFEIWGRAREARFGTYSFSNQFRISQMGPDDETDPVERSRYQAFKPSVAYNPIEQEFLVVWFGDDNTGPLVDDEYEIFGRRVDGTALLGDAIDSQFRITTVGDDSETDPVVRARYDAFDPKVVFDPTTGGYMLIYRADDPTFTAASGGPLADDEFEIFGQALDAAGQPVGAPFRISTMGDDLETDPVLRANYGAFEPALVWNDTANQFMAVWRGDDNNGALVDDENEVYARAFDSAGSMPSAQLRVSAMGTDGDAAFDAFDPAIAVNSVTGEYMVTWSGDDDTAPLVDDEFEIFAQELTVAGALTGTRFRVSSMGPDGDAAFDAEDPSIAFHPGAQRFQIGWRGDDNTAPLLDNEFQLHAQSVEPGGILYETAFQVTQINTGGDTDAERIENSVNMPGSIYAGGNIYHFYSSDGPALSPGNFEIFLQRTSTFQVELDNEFSWNDSPAVPVAPEPMVVTFVANNAGTVTAPNAALWFEFRNDDLSVVAEGCDNVDPVDTCELGTLAPGETRTITFTIDTSSVEIGTDQGGLFIVTFHADAAIRNFIDDNGTPDDDTDNRTGFIDGSAFIAVVLEVKGGSGALLPLIPALLLLWGMVAIRRR